MEVLKFKRIIRSKLEGISNNRRISIGPLYFAVGIFAFSLIFFCLVQLGVNSILFPKGQDLRNFDSEKNALLEENRLYEQRIAQLTSLSVVKARAEKELAMSRAKSVVYVNPAQTTVSSASTNGTISQND